MKPFTDYGSKYDEMIEKIKNEEKQNKNYQNEETKKEKHKFCLTDHLQDSHLLKKMSVQISAETSIPISTVFLNGLSIYSSMALRAYSIAYENGALLPSGLYTTTEQPPGAAKTWCMNSFQSPFFDIHESIPNIDNSKPCLFITNATPEGMEITLPNTLGFFSAASSEQGLFNALFGASYVGNDRANNNDISLNGFDGSYVNSKRVSREGYEGRVCGSITCFAQQGSIESILKASNGTGLSERFLLLSEDHNLGKRDHTRKIMRDQSILDEYAESCNFIVDILKTPKYFNELQVLKISRDGFKLINEYRNKIEPDLLDSGRFASVSLRGSAGKINMQIMKIAANLHLSDNGGMFFKSFITDDFIISAIAIANDLLEANLELCIKKGILGYKAEYTAIINYLTKTGILRSEGDIINSMKNTQPFKSIDKNRNAAIKNALGEMIEKNLLLMTIDKNTQKRIYVLSH